MAKITLTDIANLQNETTVTAAVNSNNSSIEDAVENTLSRDGTSPNQMAAVLDMNSNRIINLPAAGGPNDPVRLQEFQDAVFGPGLTINAGTLSGSTLASNVVSSSLTGVGTITTGVWAGTPIAASSLSGTTLASNVVNSSITGLGTVTTGIWNAGALSTTGPITDTSVSANALAVGPAGTTNPTLQIDASTLSAATGLKVKSAAVGSGVALTTLSSGTNESLTINAKGTGLVAVNDIKRRSGGSYYVATTGNDANDGLTVGTPFLTIQKAWDVAVKETDVYDGSLTISVADGTYTAGLLCTGMPIGVTKSLRVVIQGNTTTPTNCVISVTGGNCIQIGDSAGGRANVYIDGFKLTTITSGHTVETHDGSSVRFGSHMNFGAVAQAHMYTHTGGYIDLSADGYAISGGGGQHFLVDMGALIISHGNTVVISNAPAFSCFAVVRTHGTLLIDAVTWTNGGTVTGQRFSAESGGYIYTGQTSQTYIPGNSIGTESDGGRIDSGAGWTTYTPTMSSDTGAYTTTTAKSGAYRIESKTMHFYAKGTITTDGTTSPNAIVFGLPSSWPSKTGVTQLILGKNSDAKMAVGEIGSAAVSASVVLYDNTYPGGNGKSIFLSGSYEIN